MSGPNLIDRAIAYLSPKAGAERMAYRAAYSGYEAVNTGRERPNWGWNRAMVGEEDKAVTGYDRQTMLLQCQDLFRNNEIAHAVITRMADYVVHTGIEPQAQTSSKDWNEEAESFFWEWCKIADYRQRPGVTFFTLQWQVEVARMVAGESGFILMENGQLYPVEMERVATPTEFAKDPTVQSGIRYSGSGIPVGYYLCPRKNGGPVNCAEYQFIPRENFIHVMYPWRFDQRRGIPELASVISKINDLKETDKYVLLKVKNDAKQFLKRFSNTAGGLLNMQPRNASKVADAAGGQQRLESHEWGQVWNLRAGENLESFDGRAPNQQFVPYMEFQVKLLAAALGVPWEFVLMVFTDGSFSAQRSALLHALHKVTGRHQQLCQAFNQRVWNWRIAKAMKAGDISIAPLDARGASEWHKVEWALPSMGWVDPEAAVTANIKAWTMGTKSLKQVALESGRDRDDVLRDKRGDIEAAMEQAKRVRESSPDAADITWRDFINPGTQFQPSPAPAPEQATQGTNQ